MVIKAFPPPDNADSHGLLAIGGDLDVESLLLAYRHGIFPWPFEDELLAWFSPPKRAILNFDQFHIPRSLAKELKKQRFKFSINRNFPEVIKACSSLKNRQAGQGTWINQDIISAYNRLFKAGYAFSVESWLNNKLVGGIYGVKINAFISGESMFYREANASKLALCFLVEYFRGLGYSWMDCQVMTPHMKAFGAELISRKVFQKKLAAALEKKR